MPVLRHSLPLRDVMRITFAICILTRVSASQIILTQSFENPENTDWSTALGVNSTGSQVTDGSAADGASHVQFVLGENALPDYSSGAILDQYVWDDAVLLRDIESTLQVRGDVSAYIVYQVVPDPGDLDNQFFVVGGNGKGPISTSTWTTFSAGQSDFFRVRPYLGDKFELPAGATNTFMTLSNIANLPVLLASDGSPSGMTWGDAQVRWVTPTAGYSGGSGYNPDVTAELDLLIVSKIPEPTTLMVLSLFGGLLILRRFRKD